MALKLKQSWIVVSAVVVVTTMLGLAAAVDVRTREGNIDKKPARYIKDPNPAWSSIAVNADHDMVMMTDENLFRGVEYSRLVNRGQTPNFLGFGN